MRKYAEDTKVSVQKTRLDIETLVTKHGATSYVAGWDDERQSHMIAFKIENLQIRYLFGRPQRQDFARTPQGKIRTALQVTAAMEQAERSLWRGLLLLIQAKFVAITDGIRTVEEEFLADVVMPNNQTFREWASPHIRRWVEQDRLPPLLPGGDA
jgi:hypothetical protein